MKLEIKRDKNTERNSYYLRGIHLMFSYIFVMFLANRILTNNINILFYLDSFLAIVSLIKVAKLSKKHKVRSMVHEREIAEVIALFES